MWCKKFKNVFKIQELKCITPGKFKASGLLRAYNVTNVARQLVKPKKKYTCIANNIENSQNLLNNVKFFEGKMKYRTHHYNLDIIQFRNWWFHKNISIC